MTTYMEELSVCSRDAQENLQHLQLAGQQRLSGTLREKQCSVKAQKCSFFKQAIYFFGFYVSVAGFHPFPAKMEAIQSWLLPIFICTDFLKRSVPYRAKYIKPPNFRPSYSAVEPEDLIQKLLNNR